MLELVLGTYFNTIGCNMTSLVLESGKKILLARTWLGYGMGEAFGKRVFMAVI
jgi:hypothetical protein